MRSPPWSPFNTSFSSTFSTNTFSTQISSSHHEIEAEAAFSEFLMDQSASCFFHDDDDGEEERLWLEKQRAKFEFETRGIYRDPTSLPLLSDPPRLTPHHRSNSSISSSFQKSSKPKKKKSSLGKQAKEFFSSSLSLTSRKSSSKLSTAFREQSGIDTPPPTPPFRAPPFLSSPIRKEKKGAYKTCPKCNWGALQKRESCDGAKMVTCLCHADLCFGCLRDWDYCEGTCTWIWCGIIFLDFPPYFCFYSSSMRKHDALCASLWGTMTHHAVWKSKVPFEDPADATSTPFIYSIPFLCWEQKDEGLHKSLWFMTLSIVWLSWDGIPWSLSAVCFDKAHHTHFARRYVFWSCILNEKCGRR